MPVTKKFACILGGLVVGGLAIASIPRMMLQQPELPQNRKSTENPTVSTGKLCADVFLAIDHRDTKALQSVLAKGGDPNSRNGLGFMPLYIAAASHQPDAVEVLLKAGAKPDRASTYGTPLTFACATGNVQDAERFLSLGVNPDYQRTDGLTPLMMASNAGCMPLVQDLIKHKADVNNQDDGGSTALTLAARNGWTDVGKTLIDAGAKLEVPDEDGETPLMIAAMTGHADFVSMMLQNGAKVDAKDLSGRTALLLAADYGDYPDVVKALLHAKADTNAKDAKGRTAGELAALRGFAQTAQILGTTPTAAIDRTPKQAVNLSLNIIQSSMRQFTEATTCISCHQEGLGRIATGEARARGFKIDEQEQKAQAARIEGMLIGLKPLHEVALKNPEAMKQLPLIEINEVTPIDSWMLSSMAAQGRPANEATGAMAMCLARQQSPGGCWTFSLPRVPMQSSVFTFTALAVNDLNAYGPKAYSSEIAQRVAHAKDWFVQTKAQTSEDRASRLLGLKWSGADADTRKQAVADILADQRPDGGWAQLPNMQSDAYATGQALYALRVGGDMSVQDPIYEKGVQFLLRTQDDDGSWFTPKRALPANNYFDSGFPHGESQYASFNATCWATLALLPVSK